MNSISGLPHFGHFSLIVAAFLADLSWLTWMFSNGSGRVEVTIFIFSNPVKLAKEKNTFTVYSSSTYRTLHKIFVCGKIENTLAKMAKQVIKRHFQQKGSRVDISV